MTATQTLSTRPDPASDSVVETDGFTEQTQVEANDGLPSLIERYRAVRRRTEALTEPLTREDHVIQAMPEASPPKWHLAHSTWFFERFLLADHQPHYQPIDEQYEYLFNSYYNTVGPMHCRPRRGLVSRPTVEEVLGYRHEIDRRMVEFINHHGKQPEIEQLVVLGLHHEQQHQELLITDVKYNFSANPLLPAYQDPSPQTHQTQTEQTSDSKSNPPIHWRAFPGGIQQIGADSWGVNPEDGPADGFCYDHETPRHEVLIHPFAIADRLVTNGEYLAFMNDGGYERHELWLSLGWDTVGNEGWHAPIYWFREDNRADGRWLHYTLTGPRPVGLDEPVSHLSYFEADAYARWAQARLPREEEWEVAAGQMNAEVRGNFAETSQFHPQPVSTTRVPGGQMFGDLWEWTGSAYAAYPGYRALNGALGEYNGKFMCNQYVLRGGSCATPRSHMRFTYRNFFPPHARWQFTGLRLARDA